MTADRDRDVATGEGVPAPRPEILARVLERLRELPDSRTPTPRASAEAVEALSAEAAAAGVPEALLPLPRRRS